MAKLSSISKKSEALGKASASNFIKVNKFESPQAALDLVAHVCTAPANLCLAGCFQPYIDERDRFMKESEEKNVKWENGDFFWNLFEVVRDLGMDIEANEHEVMAKVAVAGGFSSGKSTFINSITQSPDLLPTGIEPVSVVNTYMNCTKGTSHRVVKAKNLSDNLVLLNEEVLDCIRHSKTSNVNVACVLKKLVIDVPAPQGLDGLTFIDTPGYNNSDAKNTENSTTDRETALSSFDEANVILWCVDIEGGCVPDKDFKVLQKKEDKDYVIVFTKHDKKTEGEVRKIIDQAFNDCKRELGDEPIDVIAFSDRDAKFFSYRHLRSFSDLIAKIKEQAGNANSYVLNSWWLDKLFEDEMQASQEAIANLQKERTKLSDSKSEWGRILHNNKDAHSSTIEGLNNVMIENYNELLETAEGEYYKEEYRKSLIDDVQWLINRQLSYVKEHYEEAQDRYKLTQESIQAEETCQALINKYQPLLKRRLLDCYAAAVERLERHNRSLNHIASEDPMDVFTAISNDDYGDFISCFSKGVDLAKCNHVGFNVMTWAVLSGNNSMVKFLADNGADLSLRDQNGHNALEQAAICHYQDICEILVEADNSLVSQSDSLVELAEKNTFTDWVKKL